MIDRVHFERFKSLENVTIELGRLTVLVGPNGCGKSSVLQGMHLLSQTGLARKTDRNAEDEQTPRWGRFGLTFGGLRDPRRLTGAERPSTIVLAMREQGGDELRLEIRIFAGGEDEELHDEIEFHVNVEGPAGLLRASIPVTGGPAAWGAANRMLDDPRVRRFVSVVYLHLDANAMTRTSIPTEANPRMRFDGAGLASVLAWMKGAAEEDLDSMTRDLARVVPGVKRIRTKRENVSTREKEQISVEGQPVWRSVQKDMLGDCFEIEFDNGASIPADLLSEGTVLALGLMTKLREPRRPRLVLLDDVDRGLHIEAQAKFVQVLRDLLRLDPDLQIVCTTHSPYLLDLFDPAELRVLALDDKRHTRAMKLTDHPEFDKWRFGVQTGELYAALGDAWVLGSSESHS